MAAEASPAATSGIPSLGVVQQWSLSAPNAGYQDQFGYAVAIDGNTAVVGARNADPDLGSGPVQDAGAAYVYNYNGKTWVLDATLTAKEAAPGDTFGVSVAISGGRIVVGATGVNLEDPNNKGKEFKDSGAAYIFTRSGGSWVQQARLTATDYAEDDAFGSAVAIYQNTAVVAASTKNLPPLVNVGAVYVFQNGGGKEWGQQAKLLPSDPFLGDYFGSSVAIYGNRIAIGAVQTNPIGENGPGKAYIYRRDGQTWTTETRLQAQGGRSGDTFGNAIALYNDTVVVGAQHADPNLGAGRVTSAGTACGKPANTPRSPYSCSLILSQLLSTSSLPSTWTSPKTWGWRRTSFSTMVRTTSSGPNLPSRRASSPRKTTCSKRSPSSSLRSAMSPRAIASATS